MANSLGDELSAALSNITALIVATESKPQRQKLVKQQAQLAGDLQVLIDEVVDEALPEYKAATAALKKVNAEAKAAKAKLDKIASTIKTIAKGVDKVAALAAKVAGP